MDAVTARPSAIEAVAEATPTEVVVEAKAETQPEAKKRAIKLEAELDGTRVSAMLTSDCFWLMDHIRQRKTCWSSSVAAKSLTRQLSGGVGSALMKRWRSCSDCFQIARTARVCKWCAVAPRNVRRTDTV